MYFLDNNQLIIGCTCNFILDSDDKDFKNPDSTLNFDSRGSSLLPKASLIATSPGAKTFESWHKPINCVLVPHSDTDIVIFISSDHLIMGYNNRASALFGMNHDMIGSKKIKEFISNFDGLFEKAKKHFDMNSGMLVEFSPVQTFLILKSGTFMRIRISINSYCVDNNIYYILTITEPGSYSKDTQRFFSLFVKFLEVFIKKEFLQLDSDITDEADDSHQKINRLLHRVRKEVELKNSQSSPELVSLNKIMWIFIALMMGIFGASYAVSVNSFENYLSLINQIDIFTDIRTQSSLINTYIIMLDMSRRGYLAPDPNQDLISNLSALAQNTKVKVN